METFHLCHLAACWTGRLSARRGDAVPLTTTAVNPVVTGSNSANHYTHMKSLVSENSVIRVAAAHMVFASRLSQDFITPDRVTQLEKWAGKVNTS